MPAQAMGDDRRLRVITALAGALAGLSLAPLGLPPLLWLALVPLWGATPAAAGLWGGAAVLVSHRWLLWLHPLDWIGVPGPLSLPICLAIWLACGLAGGGLVASWGWLVGRLDPRRLATALLASGLWGLAEVLLAAGPLFWIGLGASPLPADRALAGLAAVGGSGLVAAVQLLIGWFCWRTLVAPTVSRRGWGLGLAALLLFSHGLGWSQLRADRVERGEAFRVLVLQPALPTREKFEPERQRDLLVQIARARQQAAALGVPLLLPEGTLVLGQVMPEDEAEVLSGGFRLEGEELRSSVLRFEPGSSEASSWVDKARVVPLGEWVPLARFWRWGGLSAVGGVEPGAPARLLRRSGADPAVAICYELANGEGLREATAAGAGWLMASANLDPYPALLRDQFTALAQLRAIEVGRWLVSTANTGPSLVIDAQGVVRAALPPGRAELGVFELERLKRATTYQIWREAPLILMILLGGASWWFWFQRPRHGHSH